MSGVMACNCNPATLEAEFRNSVGSVPVGDNSPSIDRWLDCMTTCNSALGEESKYCDLPETIK